MGPEGFDRFVSGLDYPMFIVTAAAAGTPARAGCLVGFATQCSIDPARFLVCISKNNHTCSVARAAAVLGVHLLGAHQLGLAALFGEACSDEVDKFADVPWRLGAGGVPLLTECPHSFVGEVLEQTDLGDHIGFVLAPTDVSAPEDTRPLCFSQVRHLHPAHPA
jgi:flavin reductase (DIM6/NTAB) family NADH-FMN oxidoreductase RutF